MPGQKPLRKFKWHTERGGKILKVHDQGRRRLAYDIDGHREGHYYLVYFEVPAEAISECGKITI